MLRGASRVTVEFTPSTNKVDAQSNLAAPLFNAELVDTVWFKEPYVTLTSFH